MIHSIIKDVFYLGVIVILIFNNLGVIIWLYYSLIFNNKKIITDISQNKIISIKVYFYSIFIFLIFGILFMFSFPIVGVDYLNPLLTFLGILCGLIIIYENLIEKLRKNEKAELLK